MGDDNMKDDHDTEEQLEKFSCWEFEHDLYSASWDSLPQSRCENAERSNKYTDHINEDDLKTVINSSSFISIFGCIEDFQKCSTKGEYSVSFDTNPARKSQEKFSNYSRLGKLLPEKRENNKLTPSTPEADNVGSSKSCKSIQDELNINNTTSCMGSEFNCETSLHNHRLGELIYTTGEDGSETVSAVENNTDAVNIEICVNKIILASQKTDNFSRINLMPDLPTQKYQFKVNVPEEENFIKITKNKKIQVGKSFDEVATTNSESVANRQVTDFKSEILKFKKVHLAQSFTNFNHSQSFPYINFSYDDNYTDVDGLGDDIKSAEKMNRNNVDSVKNNSDTFLSVKTSKEKLDNYCDRNVRVQSTHSLTFKSLINITDNLEKSRGESCFASAKLERTNTIKQHLVEDKYVQTVKSEMQPAQDVQAAVNSQKSIELDLIKIGMWLEMLNSSEYNTYDQRLNPSNEKKPKTGLIKNQQKFKNFLKEICETNYIPSHSTSVFDAENNRQTRDVLENNLLEPPSASSSVTNLGYPLKCTKYQLRLIHNFDDNSSTDDDDFDDVYDDDFSNYVDDDDDTGYHENDDGIYYPSVESLNLNTNSENYGYVNTKFLINEELSNNLRHQLNNQFYEQQDIDAGTIMSDGTFKKLFKKILKTFRTRLLLQRENDIHNEEIDELEIVENFPNPNLNNEEAGCVYSLYPIYERTEESLWSKINPFKNCVCNRETSFTFLPTANKNTHGICNNYSYLQNSKVADYLSPPTIFNNNCENYYNYDINGCHNGFDEISGDARYRDYHFYKEEFPDTFCNHSHGSTKMVESAGGCNICNQ